MAEEDGKEGIDLLIDGVALLSKAYRAKDIVVMSDLILDMQKAMMGLLLNVVSDTMEGFK